MKKCDENVSRKRRSTDKEEWEENDLKAVNYIYSAISSKQLEFISDLETAYDIMKKFDDLYFKKSTALQIVCRSRIESIKLKDYNDVSLFFNEFEKAVNELKAAGAMVTEKEKMNFMIRSLPESHSYIGDLVDVLKEDEQTVKYVKNKIKMMNLKENDKVSTKSNAYTVETKTNDIKKKEEKNCYGCGRSGHIVKDCAEVNGKNESYNSSRGSWNRGRVRPNGRGRSYGNWQRGRGQYQNNRGGRGYQRGRGNQNYRQEENNISSFHTEMQSNMVNTENFNFNRDDSKIEIDWLLDSGCTDHVINNDEYYNEFIVLNSPVNVKIGDGRLLKATKVGNLICDFNVCYHKQID